MQIMKDKWKIDSGIRGPEKTAVKKKLISQIDVSESDEFIQVHTSFFCNFLKETICSFCSKKCVGASITERHGLCVKIVLSTLKRMIARSSGSFKDSMWLVIWKKREYMNFFRIKMCLDFNFETQIYL